MSPYLPELQLRVEGLSDGDDPAKVSVIDCESVEETEYQCLSLKSLFLYEKGVCVGVKQLNTLIKYDDGSKNKSACHASLRPEFSPQISHWKEKKKKNNS